MYYTRSSCLAASGSRESSRLGCSRRARKGRSAVIQSRNHVVVEAHRGIVPLKLLILEHISGTTRRIQARRETATCDAYIDDSLTVAALTVFVGRTYVRAYTHTYTH